MFIPLNGSAKYNCVYFSFIINPNLLCNWYLSPPFIMYNAEMSGPTHNEERHSLARLLCVGRSIDLFWRCESTRRQGKSISTAHLGIPAARSAAGTYIMCCDTKHAQKVYSLAFFIDSIFISLKGQ